MEQLLAIIGSDLTGEMFTADCLQIEGEIWLVPSWRVHQSGGWKSPERMIRVPEAEVQRTSFAGHDLLIAHPIPTAVLTGQHPSPLAIGYVVMEAPDEIRIPIPKRN